MFESERTLKFDASESSNLVYPFVVTLSVFQKEKQRQGMAAGMNHIEVIASSSEEEEEEDANRSRSRSRSRSGDGSDPCALGRFWFHSDMVEWICDLGLLGCLEMLF